MPYLTSRSLLTLALSLTQGRQCFGPLPEGGQVGRIVNPPALPQGRGQGFVCRPSQPIPAVGRWLPDPLHGSRQIFLAETTSGNPPHPVQRQGDLGKPRQTVNRPRPCCPRERTQQPTVPAVPRQHRWNTFQD